MWWYHLFGLLWTSQFLIACEEMVVAGAIAGWYFSRDKKQVCSLHLLLLLFLLLHPTPPPSVSRKSTLVVSPITPLGPLPVV